MDRFRDTPHPPFPLVVGSGRCGSTLLRLMLDAHAELAVPAEAYFPVDPPAGWMRSDGSLDVARAVERLERRPWLARWELAPGAFAAAAADEQVDDYAGLIRSLFGAYARAHGKPRYGNKTPEHVLSIDPLSRRFPEARFIHIVRDGRDVSLSLIERDSRPTDLAWAAGFWRRRVEQGRTAGRRLGAERYREVRYEDLLENPERALRDLCEFIDLPFDDAMLRYHEHRAVSAAASHRTKLSKPPTKGMRSWRDQMTRSDVLLVESIAGSTLEMFGYGRSGIVASPVDRLRVDARRASAQARTRVRALRGRTARVRHD